MHHLEIFTTPSVLYRGKPAELTAQELAAARKIAANFSDLKFLSLECEDGQERFFNPANVVWIAVMEDK